MIKKKTNKFFAGLLLFIVIAFLPKINTAQNNTVQLTATAPTVPVLKGLSSNPLLRIRIYIPAGSAGINYRQIQCSLNETAIGDVDELFVFFTDGEPLFDASKPLLSIRPSSTQFNIPVDLKLKPGLHYIWMGATLKQNANIDQNIELHARSVTDASNKKTIIIEDNFFFKKRMGIALRKAGDEGVHTFRIPGIIATDKKTLIAVYDIRYKNSADLPGNIDIGMSRSTDGGRTWDPMKVIMDMGEPNENNGVGDPSVLFDPVTKKIWVAALWSKGNRSIAGSKPGLSADETGQFNMVSSNDDGLTWSAPQSITGQVKNPAWKIFFPGPGNGIAMQDGKIVFPAQYWDADHMPYSTLVYSDDHGASWKAGIGAKPNTTESQLVETTPGTLMLNMRDNRGGFRSIATTKDFGKTWTEHPTSYKALIDPVCMASFIKATMNIKGKKKEVLLFSNVASQTSRQDMSIKASLDLGESWLSKNLLIDERKSYGYSALTKIDDSTIGLLYEGIRELYFVRIPVQDIIK